MNWLLKLKIQSKQKQLLREKEKLKLLIQQEEIDKTITKTKESQEALTKKEELEDDNFIERSERFEKRIDGLIGKK